MRRTRRAIHRCGGIVPEAHSAMARWGSGPEGCRRVGAEVLLAASSYASF
jgi:hypothetical protein